MNKSLFKTLELSGILLCMAAVSALREIYTLTRGNIVGIIFGSVNNSQWEQLKPVILSYILYGFGELFCAKPYFRRFVSAKALGLYGCVVFYLIMSGIIPAEYNAPVTLASLALGFMISLFLTLGEKDISTLFSVSCFMLLLIFVMYFSFSAFPLKHNIFLDKESGMYGIIPDYIDIGASVLVQK